MSSDYIESPIGNIRQGNSLSDIARDGVGNSSLVREAKTMKGARAIFSSIFPGSLFRDSAWDMMLELYIVQAEGRSIFMKQLAAAVGETSTGAARRIGGLERAGLVTRRVDPEDHRRSEIALTPTGEAAITTLLKHIFDNQPVENIGSKIRPVSFHPEESRGRR